MALPKPVSRADMYLSYLNYTKGLTLANLPKPVSRADMYLYNLCINRGIGGGSGGSNVTLNGEPQTNFNFIAEGKKIKSLEVGENTYEFADGITDGETTLGLQNYKSIDGNDITVTSCGGELKNIVIQGKTIKNYINTTGENSFDGIGYDYSVDFSTPIIAEKNYVFICNCTQFPQVVKIKAGFKTLTGGNHFTDLGEITQKGINIIKFRAPKDVNAFSLMCTFPDAISDGKVMKLTDYALFTLEDYTQYIENNYIYFKGLKGVDCVLNVDQVDEILSDIKLFSTTSGETAKDTIKLLADGRLEITKNTQLSEDGFDIIKNPSPVVTYENPQAIPIKNGDTQIGLSSYVKSYFSVDVPVILSTTNPLEQVNINKADISRLSNTKLDTVELVGNNLIFKANDNIIATIRMDGLNTHKWVGAKVNFLGDSLTAPGRYQEILKEIMGFSVIRNYGVGGTTVTSARNEGVSTYRDRAPAMDDDADLIIVFTSINDNASPMGTPDSEDVSTIGGAGNVLAKMLQEKYPTKTIVFTSHPHLHWNSWAGEAADMYKQVCETRGIPFCDLLRTSGINGNIPTSKEHYFTDGIHLTEAGFQRVAETLAGFLKML